jgi:carbon-monoxide dehydrogenase medium subunit
MEIRSASGARIVPAEEFFLGPYETAVCPGELLVKVSLPPPKRGHGEGYEALRVAGDSWSLAQAAVRLQMEGATVVEARVALGCVAWTPVRASAVEAHLRGREAGPETLREAADLAGEGLDPPCDAQASGEYRREMAKVMTRRALLQALGNVRR